MRSLRAPATPQTSKGLKIMPRQQHAHTTTEILPANAGSFPYADYLQAKQALQKALHGPRFYALVVGPSGTGKTCLMRDLTAEVDRGQHHIIYVSSPRASVVSIVRLLASAFHVNPHHSHLETVHSLAEAIQIHSTHLVLWVDEADQLDPNVLQQFRTLAEASPSPEPWMSIVLSGLFGLLDKLSAPDLFPLKRRISLRCNLSGLRRTELDSFIVHRFGTRDAQRIAVNVRDELFERTLAAPALIDQVLRHALAQTHPTINAEVLHAILDNHGL
jgi:type II secretory pathway predicted ATPase ExeA